MKRVKLLLHDGNREILSPLLNDEQAASDFSVISEAMETADEIKLSWLAISSAYVMSAHLTDDEPEQPAPRS